MTPRQQTILTAITAAAETGAPCPTNDDLNEILGHSGAHDASQVLTQLEKLGLIVVTRFGCGREVFVPSTGKSTAPFTGARRPHWRLVAKADRVAPLQRAKPRPPRGLPPVEILPPVVVRDPCPRCGTRADLGCGHRQVGRLIVGASA